MNVDLTPNELDLLIGHAMRQHDDYRRLADRPPATASADLRKAYVAGHRVWFDLLTKLTLALKNEPASRAT